ncbi:MAG: phytoene synthase [Verrucomicrobiales bacterium]|jgi:phytoene synthase
MDEPSASTTTDLPSQVAETEDDPEEITRSSRSNLAFAFACLPKQQRTDMTTFYAFCRIVDDIADDPAVPVETRREQLLGWKNLVSEITPASKSTERALVDLLKRYPIDREMVLEIIRGVEMDLDTARYQTYADLEAYCFRVASAVGLVSIEIFGYTDPSTPKYAVELGHALQLTNIMRDVGEDIRDDDRIYLPLEDLERFGVSEADLREANHTEAFARMMEFQAERAESRYARARQLLAKADRRNLRTSQLMHSIYYALLKRMRSNGFRVLEKRCSLPKWQKIWLLIRSRVFGR